MARRLYKFDGRGAAEDVVWHNGERSFVPTACKTFGGDCKADGCTHWFPVPSADGAQEAQCFLERGEQPITYREALRKAKANERGAAGAPDPVNARASRQRAAAWHRLAQTLA